MAPTTVTIRANGGYSTRAEDMSRVFLISSKPPSILIRFIRWEWRWSPVPWSRPGIRFSSMTVLVQDDPPIGRRNCMFCTGIDVDFVAQYRQRRFLLAGRRLVSAAGQAAGDDNPRSGQYHRSWSAARRLTIMPAKRLPNYLQVDHAIIGEGERSLPELVRQLAAGEAVPQIIPRNSPLERRSVQRAIVFSAAGRFLSAAERHGQFADQARLPLPLQLLFLSASGRGPFSGARPATGGR